MPALILLCPGCWETRAIDLFLCGFRLERDESGYYSNKYYKQGWQDGQHHKHKDHKWKNDKDREAYEAGYNHGDHGEQWKEHR